MRMKERHKKIEELLSGRDYMTVEELSETLGVSKVTIRSDLSLLEEKGILFRTHGGAMLSEIKSKRRFVNASMNEYSSEKDAIGKLAASLISDNSVIIIDVGSTTVRVTDYIKNKNLSVVTNNLLALDALQDAPNLDIYALGGQYRQNSKGFIGNTTISSLLHVNADILFMGATTYDDKAIYTSNIVEAETKAAMMKVANRIVFMADSSKSGKHSYAKITEWKDIDTFITDKISYELRAKLENEGVEVLTAEDNTTDEG